MSFKLSICIPTYNMARFLPVLLDSILEQNHEKNEIEICISDNASVDETSQIIAAYKERYKNINYVRLAENIGYDLNCLNVVAIANGEYIWLMGADDIIEKEAINYVLNQLEHNFLLSGISLDRNIYSAELKQEKYIPSCYAAIDEKRADIIYNESEKIFAALGNNFGYISAQIVKKHYWDDVIKNNDIKQYLAGYVHMFIIGKIVSKYPCWLFSSGSYVGWRGENDSLLASDRYKRLQTDVLNYSKIFKAVIGAENKTYRKIISWNLKYFIKYVVIHAKIYHAKNFLSRAFLLTLRYYWNYPLFWGQVFPFFLLPTRIVKVIRIWYRKLYK